MNEKIPAPANENIPRASENAVGMRILASQRRVKTKRDALPWRPQQEGTVHDLALRRRLKELPSMIAELEDADRTNAALHANAKDRKDEDALLTTTMRAEIIGKLLEDAHTIEHMLAQGGLDEAFAADFLARYDGEGGSVMERRRA